MDIQVRGEPWDPLGEHCLSDTGTAVKEDVIASRCRYLTGQFGLHLSYDICHVETRVCVLSGPLPITSTG
jgi:hypothetical protein